MSYNNIKLKDEEKQDLQELEMRKVLGNENPADMMTQYMPRLSLDNCMTRLNHRRVQGRAQAGLLSLQSRPVPPLRPVPPGAWRCGGAGRVLAERDRLG